MVQESKIWENELDEQGYPAVKAFSSHFLKRLSKDETLILDKITVNALSITDIAKFTGLCRMTCSRLMYGLEIKGLVHKYSAGMGKIYKRRRFE